MSVALISVPLLRISTGALASRAFEIRQALRIGRHPFNEISLADPGLSRYHCWVVLRNGVHTVEDLASANGTFVNGVRLQGRHLLKRGDVIRVGSTELTYSDED
jgi:pSer/pThr/pTyr-binding forkhead associated (FHA) protein